MYKCNRAAVAVLTSSRSVRQGTATARIQPLSAAQLHDPAGGCDQDQKQVVYTVWMKSLVFNGHGCTIYGQDGRVAYRVDNYACTRRREVFIMDTAGKALIKLQLKKTWQGYSCCDDGDAAAGQQPWFSVRKEYRVLKNGRAAVARVTAAGGKSYTIDGAARGSEYYRVRNVDGAGAVVAEVGRKRTASGVALGEDVLTLTVGPAADRLLVVGLVVVCGLLSRSI